MYCRKHYCFKGKVQGVGFRFTFAYKARELSLVGWVKNNSDGSVEAEVEGEDYKVANLISFMNQDLFIEIKGMDVKQMDVKKSESTFSIKY